MTQDEAIILLRQRLDDTRTPYLWSDEALIDSLRAAMQEAADRSRMIEDTETIVLESAEATYQFTLPVLLVSRVMHEDSTTPLQQRTIEWLDRYRPGWADETGQPYEYIANEDSITVIPTPEAAADLTVKVYRGITDDDELSIIPARYHRDLLSWVEFECYSRRDPDGESSPRAQTALAQFERRFGPRKSAIWDRVSRSLPVGATGVSRRIA